MLSHIANSTYIFFQRNYRLFHKFYAGRFTGVNVFTKKGPAYRCDEHSKLLQPEKAKTRGPEHSLSIRHA